MTDNHKTTGKAVDPIDGDVPTAEAAESTDADNVDIDETAPEGAELTEPVGETATVDGDPEPAAAGKRRRSARLGALAVAVILVLSAGLTAWLYFFQYRPDQQSDAAAAQVALEAATTGTTALLSYSPDTLDQNFADAKSHLTGEFLDYYTQFTQTIVTPAAREKQVQTSATVVQSAIAEMHPESAVALLFINQTTISKENPDGAFAASSVKVGLTKIDGKWLIATFDPV